MEAKITGCIEKTGSAGDADQAVVVFPAHAVFLRGGVLPEMEKSVLFGSLLGFSLDYFTGLDPASRL